MGSDGNNTQVYLMFVESYLGVNIGTQPAYIVHSSSSLKSGLPHC